MKARYREKVCCEARQREIRSSDMDKLFDIAKSIAKYQLDKKDSWVVEMAIDYAWELKKVKVAQIEPKLSKCAEEYIDKMWDIHYT